MSHSDGVISFDSSYYASAESFWSLGCPLFSSLSFFLFPQPLHFRLCGQLRLRMTGYLETPAGTDKMGGKQVVHDVEDRPQDSAPRFRAVSPDDGQIVTQQERQSLIRGLSQRHVQMIAIAGAIVRNLQEPTQVELEI